MKSDLKAIRLLKPVIIDGTNRAKCGESIQVPQQISQDRANKLVRKGLAIPVSQNKDIDKTVRKVGPVPPTEQPQDGTHTGEEQQSSVLDQDQAPKKRRRTYKKSSKDTKASKRSKS